MKLQSQATGVYALIGYATSPVLKGLGDDVEILVSGVGHQRRRRVPVRSAGPSGAAVAAV